MSCRGYLFAFTRSRCRWRSFRCCDVTTRKSGFELLASKIATVLCVFPLFRIYLVYRKCTHYETVRVDTHCWWLPTTGLWLPTCRLRLARAEVRLKVLLVMYVDEWASANGFRMHKSEKHAFVELNAMLRYEYSVSEKLNTKRNDEKCFINLAVNSSLVTTLSGATAYCGP